jgi:hypothetical protein
MGFMCIFTNSLYFTCVCVCQSIIEINDKNKLQIATFLIFFLFFLVFMCIFHFLLLYSLHFYWHYKFERKISLYFWIIHKSQKQNKKNKSKTNNQVNQILHIIVINNCNYVIMSEKLIELIIEINLYLNLIQRNIRDTLKSIRR